jgi:hypothetical protein
MALGVVALGTTCFTLEGLAWESGMVHCGGHWDWHSEIADKNFQCFRGCGRYIRGGTMVQLLSCQAKCKAVYVDPRVCANTDTAASQKTTSPAVRTASKSSESHAPAAVVSKETRSKTSPPASATESKHRDSNGAIHEATKDNATSIAEPTKKLEPKAKDANAIGESAGAASSGAGMQGGCSQPGSGGNVPVLCSVLGIYPPTSPQYSITQPQSAAPTPQPVYYPGLGPNALQNALDITASQGIGPPDTADAIADLSAAVTNNIIIPYMSGQRIIWPLNPPASPPLSSTSQLTGTPVGFKAPPYYLDNNPPPASLAANPPPWEASPTFAPPSGPPTDAAMSVPQPGPPIDPATSSGVVVPAPP